MFTLGPRQLAVLQRACVLLLECCSCSLSCLCCCGACVSVFDSAPVASFAWGAATKQRGEWMWDKQSDLVMRRC